MAGKLISPTLPSHPITTATAFESGMILPPVLHSRLLHDQHPYRPICPAPASAPAAPTARRRAPWVILACVPSVSSSDDELKVGDDLSFDWLEPPRVSLLTVRRSDSVSAVPQDVSPDRDDYPYVVAVDSNGGLLLRATRRRAQEPRVVLGSDPAGPSVPEYGNVYVLCDAYTLKATPFPPDSDRRLLRAGNVGLIHAPADDGTDGLLYMVAELQPIPGTGRASLQRFSNDLEGWLEPKEVSYPPGHRPWGSNGVVSHAGKLWWVDLSYGLLACKPFSDEPELDFVALPEGCELPAGTEDLAKRRCVKVSDGKLTFVQIHDGPGAAATVSVWTLSGAEELVWTRQHGVRFEEIWNDRTYRKSQMPRSVPVLALVHPENCGVVYFFQITSQNSWVFAVDLGTRRVLKCKEYTMPHLPTAHHSSRFVHAWELPRWVSLGDDATNGSDDEFSCLSFLVEKLMNCCQLGGGPASN